MKTNGFTKIFILVFLLGLLLGCLAENKRDGLVSDELLIKKGSVGNLIPGYALNTNLPAAWRFEKSIMITNGEEGTVHEIPVFNLMNEKNEILLRCRPEYNIETESYSQSVIGNITVLSNSFKTEKGIGVGSTIKSFIDAYPDYKFRYYGQGYLSAKTESVDGSFSIPFNALRADFEYEVGLHFHEYEIMKDDLNLESKIESITIHQAEEEEETESESAIEEKDLTAKSDISKFLGRTKTEVKNDFKDGKEINSPWNNALAYKNDDLLYGFLLDENDKCFSIMVYKNKNELSQTLKDLDKIYPNKNSDGIKYWNDEVEVSINNINSDKISLFYSKKI